jgi:hypothetical protein
MGRYLCSQAESQQTVFSAFINGKVFFALICFAEDVVVVSQFPSDFVGCANTCCVSNASYSSIDVYTILIALIDLGMISQPTITDKKIPSDWI